MKLFTRLAELQVAHEERRVCKFVFEVTDYTCPVLSMDNTFSVPRDCRDDTEHRGSPNCARAGDLTGNSRVSGLDLRKRFELAGQALWRRVACEP